MKEVNLSNWEGWVRGFGWCCLRDVGEVHGVMCFNAVGTGVSEIKSVLKGVVPRNSTRGARES